MLMRRVNVIKNFIFNGGSYLIGYNKNDDINSLDFYGNKFNNITFDKTEIQNSDMYSFVGNAILTCVCRGTYEPMFYISPFLNNGKFEDVYFYCLLGNPGSFGIYDDYEIYDNLLFESIKTIPNTLMTPLKDDDTCFDKYGFDTKSIANQNTCFFAIHKINSVYSGPLISSELPKMGSNIFILNPSCYTSFKDTTFKPEDSCIYIPSDSVFVCCCSKEHKNCRIQKEKLYCVPRTSYEHFLLLPYKRISMQTYLNESVNYACGIKISTIVEPFRKNGTVRKGLKFKVEYISLNSCTDETTVHISKSEVCSSDAVKPQKIIIQKCCKNGHYCNLRLTSIKQGEMKENKCAYKPDISFHFDKSYTCEWYYHLTLRRQVYLHENFTTKILHRTWDNYKQARITGWNVRYNCSFIYAKIINVDSKDCKQNYDETGLIKPFYYCTCEWENCDKQKNIWPKFGFKCEFLMKTNINNLNHLFKQEFANDKWICFVKTEYFSEESQIEAGYLDMNLVTDKMKECFEKDIITNSKFCCVNIVKTNQNLTECTVEKQIQRFKENLNNPSENSEHDVNSEFIKCVSKDILNTESGDCPKTGGCFSTRILLPSKITSMDYIEPAGCLGYAEKYATLNLPLTSLSLGCRTNENSNRCSVIYGPNGEQRIVCCCNENNENGKCETNLEKIPNNIGKPISSFKSLN